MQICFRDHFVYAPSQWELTLQCNGISHGLAHAQNGPWYFIFPELDPLQQAVIAWFLSPDFGGDDGGAEAKEGARPAFTDDAAADVDLADDDEVSVEDEDEDEFDHFHDENEFIGFDPDRSGKSKGQEKPPDLKINKVSHKCMTCRADSRFAPCQSETALLGKDASNWLGASVESALWHLGHLQEADTHITVFISKHMTSPLVEFHLSQKCSHEHHLSGLVQQKCNSIANALELHPSCTNPSILNFKYFKTCYKALLP